MKKFSRDVKRNLRTAARVAILSLATMAGNSQTAQAGGIVDFLTKTAEFIYKSRQPIEEFRTGMSRINNEIRAGKAAFEQASYNLTDTEKQVLDVYNRVAPKQSHRQELGDAIYPAPNENPSQTRGQGNDVGQTKTQTATERYTNKYNELQMKINENKRKLNELNGDVAAHQETVGDKRNTQPNKVSKRSTQGRLTILAENFGRTE